jgi:hypothetical protein
MNTWNNTKRDKSIVKWAQKTEKKRKDVNLKSQSCSSLGMFHYRSLDTQHLMYIFDAY